VTNAEIDIHADGPERLVAEVDRLAGEVKLLAINLAIMLAKIKGRQKKFGNMDNRFVELIKRANDTSRQVGDIIQAFRDRKRMISSLPASTEIINKRGAYDSVEAKLVYVHKLSREILDTIGSIKQQKQAD